MTCSNVDVFSLRLRESLALQCQKMLRPQSEMPKVLETVLTLTDDNDENIDNLPSVTLKEACQISTLFSQIFGQLDVHNDPLLNFHVEYQTLCDATEAARIEAEKRAAVEQWRHDLRVRPRVPSAPCSFLQSGSLARIRE